MEVSPLKKRIAQILFLITVLALTANVIVSRLLKNNLTGEPNDDSSIQINETFLKDLNNFGLQSKWIKSKTEKVTGSNYYSYNIELPKDLPIPVVLSEIYGSFNTTGTTLKCLEKVIGGKSLLNIYYNNKLKLSAGLDYNKDIRRDAGSIGIIVYDLDKLDAKRQAEIIKFPQSFVAVILPSKTASQLKVNLLNNRKQYAILLNDDIKDLEFQLSKSFSDYRLKTVVSSIVGAFQDAAFYVIDDNSNLYSSPAFNVVKNEFLKRNINLIQKSSQIFINDGSNSEVKDSFRQLVRSTHYGDNKIICVHASDFDLLEPEIFSLIKIGYKFINPTLIIKPGSKDLPLNP